MTRGGAPCFHCGEAIPAGTVIVAHVHGKDETVCCHGCKAVAEFITGAGLGAKADGKRNFELGVWTRSTDLIDAVLAQFNALWEGRQCARCRRRIFPTV